jgi:hypothetical protein
MTLGGNSRLHLSMTAKSPMGPAFDYFAIRVQIACSLGAELKEMTKDV